MHPALQRERGTDGIDVIRFDLPDTRHNIIRLDLVEALEGLFAELAGQSDLRGVIVASGKPGSFLAGADVAMLAACASAAEATALARRGQALCAQVAALPVPVVAAIDGVCLGGGLEFALACHGRVASVAEHTRLGLPEVQLGLLPGSGGTQRLPRQVGIARALELMLSGRRLRPDQARRYGLVDEVVAVELLLTAARRRCQQLIGQRPPRRRLTLGQRLLEGNPVGRMLLFNQARKRLRARTHGHYPAPERIIDCVDYGWRKGLATGLQFEAERFGELAMSAPARALLHLYFASTALKRDQGTGKSAAELRPVRHIGVLGAGLMGAGIAAVSSRRAGVSVRLKDVDASRLQRGLRQLERLFEPRRGQSPFEVARARRRITLTTDYSGFRRPDLVVEAVFEDLALKQRMVSEVEATARPDTVFASNTSALPISAIAASADRPDNVVGMHYFSPVEKMPLLEVIASERTAPVVVAKAVEFGRRQGKTVIVVGDRPGFYVNRILAPYINEAARLVLAGVPIDAIDRALVRFGFPVGPLTLLDQVGFDVVAKVAPVLAEAYGERMQGPPLLDRLLADGRQGRKNGRGFYRYNGRRWPGRSRPVDRTVYTLLGLHLQTTLSSDTIAERCVLPLLNEATRCLAEGIIRSPRDGDIGAVFGIGFPPFRGGPFYHLDRLGAGTAVARLQALETEQGARFAPSAALLERARSGRRFHSVAAASERGENVSGR